MNSKLYDKIYGWLLGSGIGDAMGAPIEDMHYLDIREQFGEVNTFLPNRPRILGGRPWYEVSTSLWRPREVVPFDAPHPMAQFRLEPGVYTDDLRYRLLACKSILKRGRMITGKELAQDMLDYVVSTALDPNNKIEHLFAAAFFNMEELATMWTKRPFVGNHSGGGVWGGPCGVFYAGDPQSAAHDGGLMGAIVAAAMAPEATVDSIMQAAYDFAEFVPGRRYTLEYIRGMKGNTPSGYVQPTRGDEFRRRLDLAIKDADASASYQELIERLYKWALIQYPWPEHGGFQEFVLVPLAMFYFAKGDPRLSIIGGVNYGRDCDSTGSLAGELAGVYKGASAIPKEWVGDFVKANPDINLADTARQLTELVTGHARANQARAEKILSMA